MGFGGGGRHGSVARLWGSFLLLRLQSAHSSAPRPSSRTPVARAQPLVAGHCPLKRLRRIAHAPRQGHRRRARAATEPGQRRLEPLRVHPLQPLILTRGQPRGFTSTFFFFCAAAAPYLCSLRVHAVRPPPAPRPACPRAPFRLSSFVCAHADRPAHQRAREVGVQQSCTTADQPAAATSPQGPTHPGHGDRLQRAFALSRHSPPPPCRRSVGHSPSRCTAPANQLQLQLTPTTGPRGRPGWSRATLHRPLSPLSPLSPRPQAAAPVGRGAAAPVGAQLANQLQLQLRPRRRAALPSSAAGKARRDSDSDSDSDTRRGRTAYAWCGSVLQVGRLQTGPRERLCVRACERMRVLVCVCGCVCVHRGETRLK